MFASSANKPAPLNLFGNSNTNTNNTPAAGTNSLFGKPLGLSISTQPTSNTSLFGTAPAVTSQPQNTSLFGTAAPSQQKPAGLFGSSTTAAPAPQQQTFTVSTSNPQIDLVHLRPTTKYDHLQPSLQSDISNLDTAILNAQRDCDALGELLSSVVKNGADLAPSIEYVSTKLDELENGLGNDAEAIVSFRDAELRADEGEAKCVFRSVDRLKVPRQYQTIGSTLESSTAGVGGTSVLGASTLNGASASGLSGWWNQPHTLRGSRSASNIGNQPVQLVSDEAEATDAHEPKTLITMFDNRTENFKRVSDRQKALLTEIEDFVEGLEEKVVYKERDVMEQINYSNNRNREVEAAERREEERERQMAQLRFVFGEVQRGLFEMADKITKMKDGVMDLGLSR